MYFRGRLTIFITTLVLAAIRAAAEDFGDVTASASAMYSGNTFHGYAEIRVALENRSNSKAHVVTLVFPNTSWNNGNTLGRLSRTVKLEPNAREVALLPRPPLPANSDGNIRVEVDGQREGQIRAPNANNHCNYNSRSQQTATVFISRSLDFDAVDNLFHSSHGAFTASMAVGPPNASGGGYQSTTWMPDMRHYSQTNWLELDYATPQTVNAIEIYNTRSPSSSGLVELIGVGGTNLATIPMASGGTRSGSPGWISELSLPITSEPVKTVRLTFWKVPPSSIGIDAVQISGPAGPQWASAARASSDASSSGLPYAPGGAAVDVVESFRAESPVSEWSENWLAYSPFDGMVLNAEDLSAMSPAVLAAIGDYLQAGGNVLLAGKTDLPAAWHAAQKTQLTDGTEFDVGFGRCFSIPVENLAQLSTNSIETLRASVRDASRYWQSLPEDSGAANAAIPVVANLKIPTRGIVLIMLAFIILIGPVNIIYLARRKRRTWMLWTIPAISLATTLLVFVYSLLREGITPDTRITGLTLLDQPGHHATTIGATAFYCPLTPSSGLRFDYETEVTPLIRVGYGPGTAREMDWTDSQHLQHGWVSARVPAHFHLRKSETRRERIQIVRENGKLQIVNGLGSPIKSIWVAYPTKPAIRTDAFGTPVKSGSTHMDPKGLEFYHADNVAAGQQAVLTLVELPPAPQRSGAEGMLRDIGYTARTDATGMDSLANVAAENLLPNSYLAVLDGNPFVENALGAAASPKRTKSSSVVFGLLDPPTAP